MEVCDGDAAAGAALAEAALALLAPPREPAALIDLLHSCKRFASAGVVPWPDFNLLIIACMSGGIEGACALAPAVAVNGKVFPQMTVDKVSGIIDEYKKLEANA